VGAAQRSWAIIVGLEDGSHDEGNKSGIVLPPRAQPTRSATKAASSKPFGSNLALAARV